MMELTKDNLPIGFFDEIESYYFIGKLDDRKQAEQLKHQLLDDYEKARTLEKISKIGANIILQNQKLRGLIEELTDGDFQTITRAFGTSGIYTSIQLVRILDIFNRLEELLEESKK